MYGKNIMPISTIILTFNCENVISDTITAALKVSDDIHVIDSYSNDETIEIVKRLDVNLTQREFIDYSEQRNWAIENLHLKNTWQLHLDADEILSDSLVKEINRISDHFPDNIDGYFIPRMTRFLGRNIRHGGMHPIYHMRLFRTGHGHVERKKYDQHFVLEGKWQKLKEPIIDDHRTSIDEWISRHNRWASLEVDDIETFKERNQGNKDLQSFNVKRATALRSKYYRLPLFLRSLMLFIYRYVFRLGFLDGKEGLIYFVLQTFWFRFLVDAKLYEKKTQQKKRNI